MMMIIDDIYINKLFNDLNILILLSNYSNQIKNEFRQKCLW